MSILIENIKKSAVSLKMFLDKLEADGFLKITDNKLSVSEFVFTDLLSFSMIPVFCNLKVVGKEKANEFLKNLTDCFGIGLNEDAFDQFVKQYYRRIDSEPKVCPEGFILLENYDYNAQADSGKFYKQIGVNNPGNIKDYYLMLFNAVTLLAKDSFGEDNSITEYLEASIYIMNDR